MTHAVPRGFPGHFIIYGVAVRIASPVQRGRRIRHRRHGKVLRCHAGGNHIHGDIIQIPEPVVSGLILESDVIVCARNGGYAIEKDIEEVVIVPCFKITSSTPTKEQVFPHGTSSTSSTFFPIITTTL